MMDNDKRCAFAKVGKSSKGKLQVMKSKIGNNTFFSTLLFSFTYQMPTPVIEIINVQSSAPVLKSTGNNNTEDRIMSWNLLFEK